MARVIRSFLGLVFVLLAASFLSGSQPGLRLFAEIGVGEWLRYAAGVVTGLGGILLLMPSRAVIGSAIATAISLGMLLIQMFLAVGSPILVAVLTFLSGGSLIQAQLDEPIRTRRQGHTA